MNLNFLKRPAKANYQTVFLVLVGLLVVFNLGFIKTTGWARLCWQLVGYLALFAIFWYASFKAKDIGLSVSRLKPGFIYALVSIAIVMAGMLILFLIDETFFKDKRYHHALSTALYSGLILVPLKTVLFEELTFRGLIPALLIKKHGRRVAILVSSLAYGLWHISSALSVGSYAIKNNLVIPEFLVVAAIVLATSAAGIVFCELRFRSDSLIASIGLHWFINGGAIILAALSWKLS